MTHVLDDDIQEDEAIKGKKHIETEEKTVIDDENKEEINIVLPHYDFDFIKNVFDWMNFFSDGKSLLKVRKATSEQRRK